MKNNWIKVAMAVTAIGCFTGVVQATPISGNIGFSGTADLNSTTVNSAAAVVANGWNIRWSVLIPAHLPSLPLSHRS